MRIMPEVLPPGIAPRGALAFEREVTRLLLSKDIQVSFSPHLKMSRPPADQVVKFGRTMKIARSGFVQRLF